MGLAAQCAQPVCGEDSRFAGARTPQSQQICGVTGAFLALRWRGGGGVAEDELGVDGERGGVGVREAAADETEQSGCGGLTHGAQGLADGGEGRVVRGSGEDVVEAEDGDVGGDAEARGAEGEDGADGGDVVEGEERGEGQMAREELAGGFCAGLGTGVGLIKLDDEAGIDGEAEGAGVLDDGLPAEFGVGAEGLAFDERDAAMAEAVEMRESKARGMVVVELDVDDALAAGVAGDGDEWNGQRIGEGRVDGDDAFDGARESSADSPEQLGAMVMADDEVEEAGLEQLILNAGEDSGG